MRHFIVSTRRVLLTSGVIVRTVTLLPLRRITDLTWKETLLGQVLGYGTLPVRVGRPAAGAVGDHLPAAAPTLLYRQVSGLLFSSDWGGAAASGDDEGNPEAAAAPRRRTSAVATPSRSRASRPSSERPAGCRDRRVRQAERRCGSTCTPTPRCPTAPRRPAELLATAQAAGLDVVALTDHDTTAGWAAGRGGAAAGADRRPRHGAVLPLVPRRPAADQRPPAGLPVRPAAPRLRRRARAAAGRAARPRRADRRGAGRRRLPGRLGADRRALRRRRRRPPAHRAGPGRGRRGRRRSTTRSPRSCTTAAPTTWRRSTPTSGRASRWSARPAGCRCSRTAWPPSAAAIVGDDAIVAMVEAGLLGLEVDHPDHTDGRARAPARARAPTSD